MRKTLVAFLFVILLAPAVTNAALTDQLVGYWSFDEASGNASDALSANTLTVTAPATRAAGILGNAASITHSGGGFFRKSSPTSFLTGGPGNSFSIQEWIRPASIVGGSDIFTISSFDDRWQQYWYVIGGSPRLETGGLNQGNGNWTTSFVANTWYHLVTVVQANVGVRTYVNGSLVNTTANGSTRFTTPTTDITVGAYLSTDRYWDGRIDEVGVWNRALTASEIITLYNAGAGLAYPFTLPSSPTSPFFIAFWW